MQHFVVDSDVLFYAPRKRPESVGPNGKITLVKCFADLASPRLDSLCVRVQSSTQAKKVLGQAKLILNVAAPDAPLSHAAQCAM